MTIHVTGFFSVVAKRSAFNILSRYVYPELLIGSLYFAIWFDPYFFGENGFVALAMGLWLDFAFSHSQVATNIIGLFFNGNSLGKKITTTVVSLFYLLFIGGISIAIGSYLTAIAFIVLSFKRIVQPAHSQKLLTQVGFAFARIMLLVSMGLVGFLLSTILPSPVGDLPIIETGAEMVPAWGLSYFVALHFFERWVVKNQNAGAELMKPKGLNKNRIRRGVAGRASVNG